MAERRVDCLILRCRIVGQNFNSGIGITQWNDTGLLHAQDSHVDLSLTEATGRVDDCITLEPIGKCGYGRESEANVRGNARHDKVLAPCSFNRIDERLSSHALTVVRSILCTPCRTSVSSGISGPYIFSVVVVTITGTLSASIDRVRATILCLS